MMVQFDLRCYEPTHQLSGRRVGICTLSSRHYVAEFADAREAAVIHALGNGMSIVCLSLRSSVIAHSRNLAIQQLVERCPREPQPEFLLFLDDDMLFPPDVVQRLVTVADMQSADILGTLAVTRAPPFRVCALKSEHERFDLETVCGFHERREVLEVAAVGMGCTLIRTAIIRSLSPPYFSQNHNLDIALEIVKDLHKDSVAGNAVPSQRLENVIGLLESTGVWGEDFSFCLKARRKQARVLCDFGILTPIASDQYPGVAHLGTYPYSLRDALRHAGKGR
jgi:hypothetical protein